MLRELFALAPSLVTQHLLEYENADSKIGPVQFIVDNLCIAPAGDHSHIEIFTKTNLQTFTIKTIEVRRETRHRSTNYPDLLLKLNEVQSLSLELSSIEQGHYCHAWTTPKRSK